MSATRTPKKPVAQKQQERRERKQKSALGNAWLELHPDAKAELDIYLSGFGDYLVKGDENEAENCQTQEPNLQGFLDYLDTLTEEEGEVFPWRSDLNDSDLAASLWFVVWG